MAKEEEEGDRGEGPGAQFFSTVHVHVVTGRSKRVMAKSTPNAVVLAQMPLATRRRRRRRGSELEREKKKKKNSVHVTMQEKEILCKV